MADSVSGSPRWSWRLAVAGAALFFLGPLAAHFGIVPAMAGFLIFDLGGLLALIGLIVGIVGLIRHSDAGRHLAARGAIVGAVVTGCFLWIASSAGNLPRINDITTDTEHPPQFVAAAKLPANANRDMAYPGPSFAAQQKAGYPELKPLQLSVPPAEAFGRVEAAAKQMPRWEILRTDPASHTLEGTSTTRLFRFHDDFVIEVRPDGDGSLVEMRSKSRDGKGDIGANAARIEAFFGKLQSAS